MGIHFCCLLLSSSSAPLLSPPNLFQRRLLMDLSFRATWRPESLLCVAFVLMLLSAGTMLGASSFRRGVHEVISNQSSAVDLRLVGNTLERAEESSVGSMLRCDVTNVVLERWWDDLPPYRPGGQTINHKDGARACDEDVIVNSPHEQRARRWTRNEDPMHVVFIGDSITRYLYLDMAYRLHRGGGGDGNEAKKNATPPENLLNVHVPTMTMQPSRSGGAPPPPLSSPVKKDWMLFFRSSLEHFDGYMSCDCSRHLAQNVEHRFYHHPTRQLSLTYVQLLGTNLMSSRADYADLEFVNMSAVRRDGNDEEAGGGCLPRRPRGAVCRLIDDPDSERWFFRDESLLSVVSTYLPKLQPKVTHVVINSGLWPGLPSLLHAMPAVMKALHALTPNVVWRSTTQPAPVSAAMTRPGSKRSWASLSHPKQNMDRLMRMQLCGSVRSTPCTSSNATTSPPHSPAAEAEAASKLCHYLGLTPLPGALWGSIIPQNFYVDTLAHFVPHAYEFWNGEIWRFIRSL